MLRRWNEFLRTLNIRGHLFDQDGPYSIMLGSRLLNRSIFALRTAIFGACMAARETLRSAGDVREPMLIADPGAARRAFENVQREGDLLLLEDLLEVFLPTALLYETGSPHGETVTVGFRDEAAPNKILKGLTAAGEVEDPHRYRAMGDVLLVPPAVRGEGRKRGHWIRTCQLDPPLWSEHGGPYWRLGQWNLWRLDVLGWHERLALAALVGTSAEAAVVLGPPNLFPHIGFVAEVAREMGRTLIGVPFEACPPELRLDLEEARRRSLSSVQRMFRLFEGVI
ncbi:MAG: hypothetical protein ACE5G2_03345 [Candidatus Krumholzibacteriia bacterium]